MTQPTTKRLVTEDVLSTRISALLAAAPAALDTLNELAAALGNDPNFATTITAALGGKQPLDSDLTAIAALASAADKLPFATGAGAWSLTSLTSFARTLLAASDLSGFLAAVGSRDYASTTSAATLTPVGTVPVTERVLTAQAVALTVANPSGTPAGGNYLQVVVKDSGTSRAITWGTAYKAADGLTLPAATTVGKTLSCLFRYSETSSKWVLKATDLES